MLKMLFAVLTLAIAAGGVYVGWLEVNHRVAQAMPAGIIGLLHPSATARSFEGASEGGKQGP